MPRYESAVETARRELEKSGTTVADIEVGMARLAAVLGPCAHQGAVPVELVLTGEVVAWVCPGCDRQLPAGWGS